MPNGKQGARTCGVKPRDPQQQAARVAEAVKKLERIGAAFTVAEVAERAGVSRATIYRNADLRALVGAKGDVPRPVDPAVHTKIATRHEAAKAKLRDLRRQLSELEESWEAMRDRALLAEERCRAARLEVDEARDALTRPLAHSIALSHLAARLGPDAMRQARRRLARSLHPDLFAQDPAAAALATELLKTLNALAE